MEGPDQSYKRRRLYIARPRFRDWRFWVIVGLVVAIGFGHEMAEVSRSLPKTGMLYLLPVSLFLVPVVFAALNFGIGGALATAGLSLVAVFPDWLGHDWLERVGVMFQMTVVVTVAYIVGQRVEREWASRQRAEAATAALQASNVKYQGLVESSPVAILLLDLSGAILEANTAASHLFGKSKETLQHMSVVDLIGPAGAEKLLGPSRYGSRQPESLTLALEQGIELYLEPTLTQVSDGRGDVVLQVLFRDATEERNRQAGLRAYAAHVVRAQEEERQRIARELHDDTIQVLVLLCRQLDTIAADGDSLPAGFVDRLQECRQTAEEVVHRLRDFARALRPPILDDLGLATSIRRLVADLADRNGVDGRMRVMGEERRLPSHAELGLFRIAQEALWNVERHAQATRVDVTLTFSEHSTRLRVADNGVGFSVPHVADFAASGQLGLISMQERAGLLGGKLQIRSTPGRGTTVAVTVPFAGEVAELRSKGASI